MGGQKKIHNSSGSQLNRRKEKFAGARALVSRENPIYHYTCSLLNGHLD